MKQVKIKILYELTVTSLFNVGILNCDIFFFFFFIIKCQECNKNRQNVFSTTNYFAIVQRINVILFTNGYVSLKFENFAVLKVKIFIIILIITTLSGRLDKNIENFS